MLLYIPLLAGIVGTIFMTWFTSAVFRALKDPYRVVRILGNMIMFLPYTPVTKEPSTGMLVLAMSIHYLIGMIFSFTYMLLIANNYWPYHFIAAIIYGGIIGAVGVIGWRLFLRLHPTE